MSRRKLDKNVKKEGFCADSFPKHEMGRIILGWGPVVVHFSGY
jgi:hypothetical protein